MVELTQPRPSLPIPLPWRRPKLRIFISYRRDDSSGYATSIYQSLAGRFGEDQVFMDVDGIVPGERFGDRIDETLATCDVVVAVIGRDWLTAADDTGRRLDSPGDFVRRELEHAIRRGIPLVPTLVHDARLPRAEELPPSLRPLVERHAIELHNASWSSDMSRLVKAFEDLARQLRAKDSQQDVGALLSDVLVRAERVPRRARLAVLILLAALFVTFVGVGFTVHWLLIAAAIAGLAWVIAYFTRRTRPRSPDT